MTAVGWLALAVAAVASSRRAPPVVRTDALAERGRLVEPPAHPARAGQRVKWAAALAALLAVGVAATWWCSGALLGIAAAALGGTGWLIGRDHTQRRVADRHARELLAAVRLVVAELEVGTQPAAALHAAAELAPHHAVSLHEAAIAAAGAGDAAAPLLRDPATVAIGSAWQLGEQAGIPLAGVLHQVSHDLAAAAEHRRGVDVSLAGPRASAFVLAALPVLGVGLGAALGARPWAFLFGTGAGHGVCCAGVVLDAAGALWMRAILRRAERI